MTYADNQAQFDEIWRDEFAKGLNSLTGDLVLDEFLAALSAYKITLDTTSRTKDWQEHYNTAMEFCRLSRTIRFHIAKRLSSFDPESPDKVLSQLQETLGSVAGSADAGSLELRYGKDLDQIRENIGYRIEAINDLLLNTAA